MMYPKKKKKRTKKSTEAALWKVFSEYIRRRDAMKFSSGEYVKCVTCSHTGHWKEFDCGHFISRKHMATKYMEKNNNAQCKGCNGPYGAGRQYEHGRAIDRMYGEGTADFILQASRGTCKWGEWEFSVLIEEYKLKIKELNKI